MLCYLDKTFCIYSSCKHWDKCDRAATDKLKKEAEKFGLPICYFASKPDCYEVDYDDKQTSKT